MSEANPDLAIPMLAIYLLAAAQRDGREFVFSPYVQSYNHGFLFGPFSLQGFDPSAAKFGQPQFVEPKRAASYIAAVAKYCQERKMDGGGGGVDADGVTLHHPGPRAQSRSWWTPGN